MINWKYTSSDKRVVMRTLDNGGVESCLVEAIADWIAAGNTAEPADVPPATDYKAQRAPLYPPVTDGLDAIVKGGQALEDWKAACMAVKLLVPKTGS